MSVLRSLGIIAISLGFVFSVSQVAPIWGEHDGRHGKSGWRFGMWLVWTAGVSSVAFAYLLGVAS